jgi:hypothetical protein
MEEEIKWPSLQGLQGDDCSGAQHKLNLIVKRLRLQQFIAKNIDKNAHHITRVLSSSEEGEALVTTVPAFDDLRFGKNGIEYVHALRTRLGLPIMGIREGPCHCRSERKRGHCDATGYHACICIAQGQRSGVQATHNDGKRVLRDMCIEAGYRALNESSESTQGDDPLSRKRTDVILFDGLKTYDLDYGVTDPRKGYLGSKKWNKLQLTTPAFAASNYENEKWEYYDEVPNLYPCIIESFGRWGTGLKNFFNTKLKPMLKFNAKHQQQNGKAILQWKKRLTMGMFKGYASHLHSRVKEIMARNQVVDREHAGLKQISDDVQERIDNYGALTVISSMMGQQIPFSID